MIANPNDGNSPRVEVATPMIDVSAGGLITATTEQEKGYVSGGTKSATQQLTTQGAKTVTPGTTAQTAVASGRYVTGDVVVSGDANLVPENIAEGVSIFGVTGTHSGGGQMIVDDGLFSVDIGTSIKITINQILVPSWSDVKSFVCCINMEHEESRNILPVLFYSAELTDEVLHYVELSSDGGTIVDAMFIPGAHTIEFSNDEFSGYSFFGELVYIAFT